jgi:hypothetical protein
MCHGHVDLRVIEREVQDRLRAAKPVASVEAEEDVTVPPGLIGGLPGIIARRPARLLPSRRRIT